MGLLKWLRGEDMDYGVVAALFGFIFLFLGLQYLDVKESTVFSWLFALSPIWLPITTFSIFFYKYMEMVGKLFYLDCGRVTYEVVLPQEVYKSPEAMEAVFSMLFNKASPDNLMETYLQGKQPQIFSFEIVSVGGEVKFYVNLPIKKGEKMLESAFYAQYPGIELRRQEMDYTGMIPGELGKYFAMSFHMTKNPGKSAANPIKTYRDLHLHDLPKEEEKVDPLTQLVEFMSSIKPSEIIWVQFLCKAHREESFKLGQLRLKPHDHWPEEAHDAINKIMQRDPKTKAGPTDIDGMPRITPGERETVEAIERNAEKPAFEMVSRWIYFCDLEKQKPIGDNFAGMLRSYAAYDVIGRGKVGITWRTDFNYKFVSDPFGTRLKALRKQEVKEYKLRKLFSKFPTLSKI